MTETPPSEAVIDAWINLMRAQHRVLSAIEDDLKKAGFPSLSWYDVLLELRRAGEGLRPLEIEARLLLAQHNVSRLVDRLERAGYAVRKAHETDGRGQRVEITQSGLDLLDRMWPAYRTAIGRHLGDRLADEPEARSLAGLLGKLVAPGR